MAVVIGQLKVLLSRGWHLELRHWGDRRDLPSSLARAPAADCLEVETWLHAHPDPEVRIALGYVGRLVEIFAVDSAAARRVEALLPAETVRFQMGDDGAAVFLFAAPVDRAVFRRSNDANGLVINGENDWSTLPGGLTALGVLVEGLPVPIPTSVLDEFPTSAVPIDGAPRFRELGRSGVGRPWWTTDAAIAARTAEYAASDDDATITVCVYVAPDPSSDHVCDLLIETDHQGDGALELARRDTVVVVRRLLDLGVPRSAIDVMYSGNKSLHTRVGHAVFGQTAGPNNNEVMGQLAERLFGGIVNYDRTLFHRRQKSRLVGTRNSKTGLYAVPVLIEELEVITEAELRQRARDPVGSR